MSFIQECCQNCGKADTVLLECNQCKVVYYCSESCKKHHRQEHSKVCFTEKGDNLEESVTDGKYVKEEDREDRGSDEENSSFNEMVDYCQTCNRSHIKLLKCSGCKSVNYCSKKCQETDWPKHKKICKRDYLQATSSTLTNNTVDRCKKCAKTGIKLSCCSRCLKVKYCSKVCQKADWIEHKKECKGDKPQSNSANGDNKTGKSCESYTNSGIKLSCCSQCRKVYCSEVCQIAHWIEHKKECKGDKPQSNSANGANKTRGSCESCKRSDIKLSFCSWCRKVKYCSKVCEKADLIRHKKECKGDKPQSNSANENKKTKCFFIDIEHTDKRDAPPTITYKYAPLVAYQNIYEDKSVFPVPQAILAKAHKMFPSCKIIIHFIDVMQGPYDPNIDQILIAYIKKPGYHYFIPHVYINDDDGKELHVFLYHKEPSTLPYFTLDQLKVGNYICIIKPKIHDFIDGAVGFRINFAKEIRFIET